MNLETNLDVLAKVEQEKERENLAFRDFLKQYDEAELDNLVNEINEEITPLIDCTACGNCCNSLMINVEPAEAEAVSKHLQISITAFKEAYIETSTQGQMVINTIPCHFLKEKKCTIYNARFEECRAFPHLHKPQFKQRIFGTLMHYGRCPIIFNVVERLKQATAFL
jgi:uncharacterized protein